MEPHRLIFGGWLGKKVVGERFSSRVSRSQVRGLSPRPPNDDESTCPGNFATLFRGGEKADSLPALAVLGGRAVRVDQKERLGP